jgi:hypothetical protein
MVDSGARSEPRTRLVLLLCLGLLSAACHTASSPAPMSIEEAGIVAALDPHAPPPRTIDDIVAALYEQRRTEPRPIDPLEADAVLPPDTTDRHSLVRFYFKRALAAFEGGRIQQGVADLLRATE